MELKSNYIMGLKSFLVYGEQKIPNFNKQEKLVENVRLSLTNLKFITFASSGQFEKYFFIDHF